VQPEKRPSWRERRAGSAAEYGLIVAALALAMFGFALALGGDVGLPRPLQVVPLEVAPGIGTAHADDRAERR
jgi:hypothetical protein